MVAIIYTPRFDRAYARYTRRDEARRACVDRAINRLEKDPNDPRLRTHMLTGELAGLFACSCGYDCRIVFDWRTDSKTRRACLHLPDVGTHDEVY